MLESPTPSQESADGPEALPLTIGQERLWFFEALYPGTTAYNLARAYRIRGYLDTDALARALDGVVDRHESLRTTIDLGPEGPVQLVHPAGNVRLARHAIAEHRDTSGGDASDVLPAGARDIIDDEVRRPFDLRSGPLLRATLVQLGPQDHVFVLVIHHIVFDGWSRLILNRELGELYESFRDERPPHLSPPEIQFADVALWQRTHLDDESITAPEISWWQATLDGAPAVLELPSYQLRPAVQRFHGASLRRRLAAATQDSIRALGSRMGATPFMVLLAAFDVLLARLSGSSDLVVGTTSAGRVQPETADVIGFFINTLPLRVQLGDDPSFEDLVGRVRAAALEAWDHQTVPFDRVVDALDAPRDASRSPVFQVMFTYQEDPAGALSFPGTSVTPIAVDVQGAMFDVTLYADRRSEGLDLTLEYSTDLFDAAWAERTLDQLTTIVDAALAEPTQPVSLLPVLRPEERRMIVGAWNATAVPVDGHRLEELVARRIDANPDSVALIAAGTEVTFSALGQQVETLASRFSAAGLVPGDRVAVCLERGVSLVASILAILRCRAAWVPLDPAYPAERLSFMLGDSAPRLVVTTEALRGRLPVTDARIVALDAEDGDPPPSPPQAATDDEAAERSPASTSPAETDDLAYVLYTSGSTGRPKGVMGQHLGAVNRIRWAERALPWLPSDVACLKTSISFGDSISEIFSPLAAGVPCVVIDDEVGRDAHALIEALAAHGVTRTVVVPSLARAWLDMYPDLGERLPALRILVLSGEAVSVDLADRLRAALPGVMLPNLYGSSEVSADATWHALEGEPTGASVAIGRPLDNTRVYLLDGHGEPVPIGAEGEIFVGGAGVALGYLDRPELTAERFVPEPFVDEPGAIMFRTGDMGRYRPDGVIEYLGRRDFQVKVRGVRIEIGEIESALSAAGVGEHVVVPVEEASGDRQLVAYVTPGAAGATPDPAALRAELQRVLPDAMIPSDIIVLEALPHLPNGKVDRTSLPKPSSIQRPTAGHQRARSDMERRLVTIWEETLGRSPVGIRDDFFVLGGHSLLAARMFARIEHEIGRRLPLALLFQHRTIEALSAALEAEGGTGSARNPIVPIQPLGSSLPLYVVPGAGSRILYLRYLARFLAPDHGLFALHALEPGEGGPYESIESLGAYYADALRRTSEGPYALLGFSFGGLVALETARALVAAGEDVVFLGLLDTHRPDMPPRGTWSLPSSFPRFLPRRILNLARILEPLSGPERRTYLRTRLRIARINTMAHAWSVVVPKLPSAVRKHAPVHPLGAMEEEWLAVDRAATRRYRPRPYPGRITFFWARHGQRPTSIEDTRDGWAEIAAGGLEVRPVAGSHLTFLLEPLVRPLASEIREQLRAALAERSTGSSGTTPAAADGSRPTTA